MILDQMDGQKRANLLLMLYIRNPDITHNQHTMLSLVTTLKPHITLNQFIILKHHTTHNPHIVLQLLQLYKFAYLGHIKTFDPYGLVV